MTVFYISMLLFAVLIRLSWVKIRTGKKKAEFIYSIGFLMGSFVWEDLLVFSIYGVVASGVTIWSGQGKYGWLFFWIFWLVRSSGEALYFFLEQFIVPKHSPHFIDAHFKPLRHLFGNISYQQCLIIMQVLFQSITMLSLVGLVVLLRGWR